MSTQPTPFSQPVFVVNARSANGETGRRWPLIHDIIKSQMGSVQVVFTQGPKHATTLAREALCTGADLVVAVGGDGTLNEVINGCFDAQGNNLGRKAAVGIIPQGTGGDYRKTHGFSTDLSEAVARLKRGRTTSVDVARLSAVGFDGQEVNCHFINIMSFGLSGMVDYLCNTTSKALGGKASFMLASARALVSYVNKPVVFTLDDGEERQETVQLVALCLGRYFGGGMMMGPDADPCDGLFDVVVQGDFSRLETIRKSGNVYKGLHVKDPKVKVYRAARVTARPVEPGDDIFIDMDGETPGKLPITAQVLPKAIDFVV